MLVISRKEQESICIEPSPGLDLSLTLREVFQGRPIVLTLAHVGQRRVRLLIDAPAPLRVLRGDRHVPRDGPAAAEAAPSARAQTRAAPESPE
jgi:sRNA-binding carbon storage regulator CsrA